MHVCMKVIIHIYLVPEVKNVVPEKKPRQRKQQSVTSNPTADLKLLPLISDLPILPSVSNVGETIDIDSQSSIKSISSVSSTQSLSTPDFILKPRQYEIVLCIDNREFYGRGYV